MWAEGRSRPVSVRWVILCGSSGCSQSKPLASSCGQHRSDAGWGEKGKNEGDLIHSGLWQVCFYASFFVFFVYLNPSSLDRRRVPGGSAKWLHLSLGGFQGLFPEFFRQSAEMLFREKKNQVDRNRVPFFPLLQVQFGFNCSTLVQFSRTGLCMFDRFLSKMVAEVGVYCIHQGKESNQYKW